MSAINPAQDEQAFARAIAFEALSLLDLRSLYEGAEMIGEVCAAVTCQPRSKGDHGHRTVLGEYAEWNSNVCGWIMQRCVEEATRCVPADAKEAGIRLNIIMESALVGEEFGLIAEAIQGARALASARSTNPRPGG